MLSSKLSCMIPLIFQCYRKFQQIHIGSGTHSWTCKLIKTLKLELGTQKKTNMRPQSPICTGTHAEKKTLRCNKKITVHFWKSACVKKQDETIWYALDIYTSWLWGHTNTTRRRFLTFNERSYVASSAAARYTPKHDASKNTAFPSAWVMTVMEDVLDDEGPFSNRTVYCRRTASHLITHIPMLKQRTIGDE